MPRKFLEENMEEILKEPLYELLLESLGQMPAWTTESNIVRIFEGVPAGFYRWISVHIPEISGRFSKDTIGRTYERILEWASETL